METELDDLTLLQFLEDDLPNHVREKVQRKLRTDARARERLEMLTITGEKLRSALGGIASIPAEPAFPRIRISSHSLRSGFFTARPPSSQAAPRVSRYMEEANDVADLREQHNFGTRPPSRNRFIASKTTWVGAIAASLCVGLIAGNMTASYLSSTENQSRLSIVDNPRFLSEITSHLPEGDRSITHSESNSTVSQPSYLRGESSFRTTDEAKKANDDYLRPGPRQVTTLQAAQSYHAIADSTQEKEISDRRLAEEPGAVVPHSAGDNNIEDIGSSWPTGWKERVFGSKTGTATTVQLDNQVIASARVVRSFAAANGSQCRLATIELTLEPNSSINLLACKHSDEGWNEATLYKP